MNWQSKEMNSTHIIIAAAIVAVAGITIATFLISEPEAQPTIVEEEYDDVFSIGTVSSDAAKMIK